MSQFISTWRYEAVAQWCIPWSEQAISYLIVLCDFGWFMIDPFNKDKTHDSSIFLKTSSTILPVSIFSQPFNNCIWIYLKQIFQISAKRILMWPFPRSLKNVFDWVSRHEYTEHIYTRREREREREERERRTGREGQRKRERDIHVLNWVTYTLLACDIMIFMSLFSRIAFLHLCLKYV